jgi:adenylyltransferase/sulfurtransferase
VLLDVREPEELTISRLPNVVNIPLAELSDRLSELDPAVETVVICRVGGRSEYATALLRHYGFGRAVNLTGGMNAWAREVDPSMPQY